VTQVSIELPEAVDVVLRCAPSDLDKELRLAAAVQWYQQGRISQEWAARIAGMDRTDFLLALARMGKESFVVDFADLDEELARG
jgi:predicted HTH domain antitoxin